MPKSMGVYPYQPPNPMPFKETRANKKLRQQLRQQHAENNTPCYLCGQPIDYTAPPHTPNACDLDHIHPTSTHPHLENDPNNIKPTHTNCNRARHNQPPRPTLGQPSQTW